MPKKTADEVLNELKAQQTINDIIVKMSQYGEDMDINAQDDTELDGLKNSFNLMIKKEQGDKLENNSLKNITNVYNAFVEYDVKLRCDALKKTDQIKERIKNGQIQGTEFMLEDELADNEKIDNLAKNIFIAENPDLVKKMKGQQTAFELFKKQLEGLKYTGQMEKEENGNVRQVNVNDIALIEYLTAEAAKYEKGLFREGKPFAEFAERQNEYKEVRTNIENDDGFEINPEYKPGDNQIDLFSKQPEEINEFMACNTKEDYEQEKEKSEFKKDACDKYISNTKVLAANARSMLAELDLMVKTNGEKDSTEFDEMRQALKAVADLDQPIATEINGEQHPPVYHPAEINDAIETLSTKAAAYEEKNKSIFGKRSDYGANRLDMSKRLQNLAAIAKPVMDAKRYDLDENKAMVTVKEEEDKRIARLKSASAKKGFGELSQHKKKIPTVAERLLRAKKNAEEAKKDVKNGSSEYDKAIKSYTDVAEIYERFQLLDEDKTLDNNQRRTALSKMSEELAKSKKAMNKYIKRKSDKGQIQVGSTADLKSQKRINAVKDGLSIVKTIENEIAAKYEALELSDEAKLAEDVAQMNEDNAEIQKMLKSDKQKVVTDLINLGNQEKENSYCKLAAKLAQKAYVTLNKLSKNNPQLPLTPDDKDNAYGAIAALTFYEILQDMDKNGINQQRPATKEAVLADVTTLMNSKAFQNIVGNDTLDVTREQIEDILADPTYTKKRVNENRKAINKINNQVDQQQAQRANNQPNAELNNAQPQAQAHGMAPV